MIFLGDVAHPFNASPDWSFLRSFKSPFVVNLEGPLIQGDPECYLNKKILFNHVSVLEELKRSNVVAACLANNHICDIKSGLDNTIKILQENSIGSFGAGNAQSYNKECVITHNGNSYVFVAFGWPVIQCQPQKGKLSGVNALNVHNVFKQIKDVRKRHTNAILICSFHWNYELERYPHPAHRQLAFDLIDMGVDCVVGHHPHIVGGVEFYKEKPVVFSLGNWWLPQGVFCDGELKYNSESFRQLAFEFSPDGDHKCHWFNYNPQSHKLDYVETSNPNVCEKVELLTPYKGLNYSDYLIWFKSNRVKSKFLPIYKDYSNWCNLFFDIWVKLRHPLIVAIRKVF